MEQVIFSCPNTLFVLPRRPDPSPDAPSVLPATVTDNSDPHQSPFWIKAVGPCWWGMDTRPLVRRNPRKSSVPHQGPSGPRRRGRPGRGPPRVRRRRPAGRAGPRVHRSVARRRVGAVQPMAGSMAGASRSRSILHGAWAAVAAPDSGLEGSLANPMARSPPPPTFYILFWVGCCLDGGVHLSLSFCPQARTRGHIEMQLTEASGKAESGRPALKCTSAVLPVARLPSRKITA
jgi:hypothetical protein